MRLADLVTPALVADVDLLDANLRAMSAALPGAAAAARTSRRTSARRWRGGRPRSATGTFTCATIREVEGMAAAGLGEDLLLANEVLDARRLGALDARVTVAVDSEATVEAAARGGVREVLIDVNVGPPALRLRARGRGRPRRPRARAAASRCAASWATRAT